ncbi:MAG TPA: hypothetical protein VME17_04610 [Bryobacteraceae bacterium]|nr:hypothetical protein [Bryobacteraceae bacterium]
MSRTFQILHVLLAALVFTGGVKLVTALDGLMRRMLHLPDMVMQLVAVIELLHSLLRA